MARNEEFDYGRVPAVLYHGAQKRDRASIEANGLTGGHITQHLDLAAEYGTPDIYEVRKHPGVVDSRDPRYGGNDWDINSGVYWANNIPASHVKRVGHVIAHMNEFGEFEHNEVHWHLKEQCPIDYDMTHPKNLDKALWYGDKLRPHPTNPDLLVSSYNG